MASTSPEQEAQVAARAAAALAAEVTEINAELARLDPTAGRVEPEWWIKTNADTRDWLRALWRQNLPRWRTETAEERLARYEEEAREAARVRWQEFAARVGLPERFQAASFEAAAPSGLIQAADVWTRTRALTGGALVLSGSTGVGKTYAAACILRAMAARSRFFVTFYALKRLLYDREERKGVIERVIATDLFVLDDFDADEVKDNKFAKSAFEEVLFARYEHRRATVLTTNASMDDFARVVSVRLMDRLREWGQWEQAEGGSLRGFMAPELDGLGPP